MIEATKMRDVTEEEYQVFLTGMIKTGAFTPDELIELQGPMVDYFLARSRENPDINQKNCNIEFLSGVFEKRVEYQKADQRKKKGFWANAFGL